MIYAASTMVGWSACVQIFAVIRISVCTIRYWDIRIPTPLFRQISTAGMLKVIRHKIIGHRQRQEAGFAGAFALSFAGILYLWYIYGSQIISRRKR